MSDRRRALTWRHRRVDEAEAGDAGIPALAVATTLPITVASRRTEPA
jgi:hypothetical protein